MSTDVGPEGGTMVVAASGTPLDGLSFLVPAGAYQEIVH